MRHDAAHRLALSLAHQLTREGPEAACPRGTEDGDGSWCRGDWIGTPGPPEPSTPSGAERLVVHHTCPTCGSVEHGLPYTLVAGRRVALSISRAPGAIAAAASIPSAIAIATATEQRDDRAAPTPAVGIGIDLERADAAGFDGFAAVALHPAEPVPADATEATRLWVRKEAVLKALGSGLRLDPRDVRLGVRLAGPTSGSHEPHVLSWPDPRPPSIIDLCDLDAPAGYVAALAVIGGRAAAYTQVAIRLDTSSGV